MIRRKNNYIKRSVKAALVVGFLLNMINNWNDFFVPPTSWSWGTIISVVSNFTVPFIVHLFLTEREITKKMTQFRRLEDESSRIIRFPKNKSDAA